MAKFSVVSNSAVILLFNMLISVCLTFNEYHFYQLENPNDESSELLQYHSIEKRDTNDFTDENYTSNVSLHLNATKFPDIIKSTKSLSKNISKTELATNQPPIINATKDISTTEHSKIEDTLEDIYTRDKTKDTRKKVISTNSDSNVDVVEGDDISINKFSDPSFNLNKTLKDNNIKTVQTDTHIYYNSSFRTDIAASQHFWVDLDSQVDMKISDLLSKSHRRAATVRLSFDFPFYGHYIRNVTIATGGFLYTGDYVHSWLAATQYIAPLMANFDTSLSNNSYIKFLDNGTAFTVLWENVSLQDKPSDGKFTFQTTLHTNGDIVFVYQNVPLIIENIQDNYHPVKMGLSDAYIIDKTIFFVRRKTIYEYHRVNFRKEDVKNGTVIYLSALPTCPILKNCTACLTKPMANFECNWCPALKKCSNGLDRSRQEWLTKGCDKRQIKLYSECDMPYSEVVLDDHGIYHDNTLDPLDDDPTKSSRVLHNASVLSEASQTVRMDVSSVMAILFIITLISGMVVWVLYAYRNPHTTSGQILIRYRPSQWSWRRGEARYTAATIHM